MVLYYALGGGLGHLARAKKVLRALGIDQFVVVTAEPQVPNALFSPNELVIVPTAWSNSSEKLISFLADYIELNRVEQVFVDTFPLGIVGELWPGFDTLNIELVYVARYLNWPRYADAVELSGKLEALHFDKCLVVDHLHTQQIEFIDSCCESRQEQKLDHVHNPTDASGVSEETSDGKWLIAHSKPVNELSELLAYTRDIASIEGESPNFLVCTAVAKSDLSAEFYADDVEIVSHYPVSVLFDRASRLITACGYNIMNETVPYAGKHHFLPFARRYDDQFLRAEIRRRQVTALGTGS